MKKQTIALSIFCTLLLSLSSCGKDDGTVDQQPTLTDMQNEVRDKLVGTWSLTSVTRDGSDVTADYSGFTISFTSSSFTTVNGTGSWPQSGAWNFKAGTTDILVRADQIEISIAFSSNDTALTMSFSIASDIIGSGRITGLAGNYVFMVSK